MPPKKTLGKRKKVVLLLSEKVEICNRLQMGVKRKELMKLFNVGSTTIHDINAQKEQLLKFLSANSADTTGGKRCTLRRGRIEKLEDSLFEWYVANRSEGIEVSASMIIERAKYLYEKMKIVEPCTFSSGWLSRFKQRHGIQRVAAEQTESINSVKPMFCERFQMYCEFFSTLVAEHDLYPDQIYNACESKLFWRCLQDTHESKSGKSMSNNLMNSRERLTHLICANASGNHKLKSFIVGEDELRFPEGYQDSSFVYHSRSHGSMDEELYVQWFQVIFVPSVRNNLRSTGKSEDSKVLLILDSRAQVLLNRDLECGNIFTVYQPTNVTSEILPMNQGVIYDLQCNYRIDVMKKLCRHEMSVDYFLSQYDIRDAVPYLVGAWESVTSDVLKKAWYHLLPSSSVNKGDMEENF